MKFNAIYKLVNYTAALLVLVVLQNLQVASANELPALQATDVVQARTDERDVKFYTLVNGLKVLLISDPSVEKSAASMDVWVGSSDDPMDRQGLAHFLEHMLFLGTEKYPEADEYQDFIAGHGGSHNAFTSATHTNYFFDIEHAHLEPALDRFAQFFISPLFNATYVERERNAVNSEYTAKYTDEYRRIRDVYREIARPGHPVNRFSVGNLDTLRVAEPRNLRDDLIRFYESHYSADRMGLVVIGKQPLEQLKTWVQTKFAAVPNRKLPDFASFEDFINPEKLPLTVEVKPRKEMREISFVFSVPSSQSYFREKPLTYIGFFIGHESEGSLLSVLKAKNWATALSAGSSLAWRGGEAFSVTINLTETGLQNTAAIEKLLFDYIAMLKNEGLEKWRFEEIRQLGEMAFEYGDKKNPMNEAMSLSNGLHYYPAELALKAPNLYEKFDKKLIAQFLAHLTPEQCVRVVVHEDAKTTTTSTYYETPYGVSNTQSVGTVDDAELAATKMMLHLPHKNPFIPTDFELVTTKGTEPHPVQVASTKNMRLWFKNDDKFALPKGYLNARLLLPEVASGVEGAAAARLYSAVVKELLNETAYSAAMAGLSFDISASSRGIDLSFTGYSDTLDQLVKAVVSELKKYNRNARYRSDVHDGVFGDASSELLRRYNNMRLDTPYRKILKSLPAQVFAPYWAPGTMAEAIAAMDREAYEQQLASLFNGAEMEVFVFGNYPKKSAQAMAKQLKKLTPRKASDKTLRANTVVNFSENTKGLWRTLPVDHSDSGVAYYIQGSDDSIAENAKLLVLQQMLSTPFYATLRTEKQLGYVVFTSGYPIREVPALIAVVQSPSVGADKIIAEMDNFFATGAAQVLANFERDKQAVLALLREDAKTQSELASDYWQSILGDDFNFDKKARLIAAVEQLSQADLEVFYNQQLLDTRRRLVVTTPIENPSEQIQKTYNVIDNTQQFKNEAPFYSFQ